MSVSSWLEKVGQLAAIGGVSTDGHPPQPLISDLGLISDRHTCAIVDRHGTLCWYCPGRFDHEAVLCSLLDGRQGGYWTIEGNQKSFVGRSFVERSSILETRFTVAGQPFTVTDWLELGEEHRGLFRRFSSAADKVLNTIRLRGVYGQEETASEQRDSTTVFFPKLGLWLRASHPLQRADDTWKLSLPPGESGWAVLTGSEALAADASAQTVAASYEKTHAAWADLSAQVPYEGLYQREVHDSIRAVQQLAYAPSGGIVAAATTSLPEVPGGERNYDYRYVWMRDISLVIDAFTQLDVKRKLEPRFLNFVAMAYTGRGETQLEPAYTVDGAKLSGMTKLSLNGYQDSRPVQVGNAASGQLQLDAHANVLLAAKQVYDRYGERFQWETVAAIADFLAAHWREDDNGIWEEKVRKPYTTSKVYAALGLEAVAKYSDEPAQAERWREAAGAIRRYVRAECMTRSGAFAVYAGSQEVDVTAVLCALQGYCELQSPEMLATMREIEAHWSEDNLYWRRLQEFDSKKEGAFLATTCWVAHYYARAGDIEKSRAILEAVLRYQNDLGFFSEEAGVHHGGQMLGNFPQAFVHSSFICAANGLKLALSGHGE